MRRRLRPLRTSSERVVSRCWRGLVMERERASAEMEFERAAALHEQYVQGEGGGGAWRMRLVRPVEKLRAVIVQEAAAGPTHPTPPDKDHPAGTPDRIERDEWGTQSTGSGWAGRRRCSLLEGGRIVGPERLSTLGVRAVKEQTSVGSSLFAQPLMLQAVPLGDGPVTEAESPEVRAERVLAALGESCLLLPHLRIEMWGTRFSGRPGGDGGPSFAAAALVLPAGEAAEGRSVLPERGWELAGEAGSCGGRRGWLLGSRRRWLRRTERAWRRRRSRYLHEGREGVERAVPVLAKRGRRSKVPGGDG